MPILKKNSAPNRAGLSYPIVIIGSCASPQGNRQIGESVGDARLSAIASSFAIHEGRRDG
jgi:hypothetical protein